MIVDREYPNHIGRVHCIVPSALQIALRLRTSSQIHQLHEAVRFEATFLSGHRAPPDSNSNATQPKIAYATSFCCSQVHHAPLESIEWWALFGETPKPMLYFYRSFRIIKSLARRPRPSNASLPGMRSCISNPLPISLLKMSRAPILWARSRIPMIPQ